jgi:hypothetical protein
LRTHTKELIFFMTIRVKELTHVFNLNKVNNALIPTKNII